MARGIKRCPECGSDISAASRKCYCGYIFYEHKKTRVKGNIVDWKTLQKGDTVRIVSEDRWTDGEEKNIRVGHRGVFTVVDVTESGLFLHNIRGCCFQDMTNSKSKVGFKTKVPTIVKLNKDINNMG